MGGPVLSHPSHDRLILRPWLATFPKHFNYISLCWSELTRHVHTTSLCEHLCALSLRKLDNKIEEDCFEPVARYWKAGRSWLCTFALLCPDMCRASSGPIFTNFTDVSYHGLVGYAWIWKRFVAFLVLKGASKIPCSCNRENLYSLSSASGHQQSSFPVLHWITALSPYLPDIRVCSVSGPGSLNQCLFYYTEPDIWRLISLFIVILQHLLYIYFRDNIDALRKVSGLLGGILVTYVNVTDQSEQPPDGFSPDASCPNGEHGKCKSLARFDRINYGISSVVGVSG